MRERRRTAEERKIDVLEAAMQEFGSFGYHGGSTERIAVAAGISQPYVLRLFGSKLQLFISTTDYVCNSILRTWVGALEGSNATGWPALMVLGQQYGQSPDAAMRMRVILQATVASDIPEIEATANEQMDRMWNWVAEATQATHEEIQRFWAYGMMQTIGMAMNAPRHMTSSDRARAMAILPES